MTRIRLTPNLFAHFAQSAADVEMLLDRLHQLGNKDLAISA